MRCRTAPCRGMSAAETSTTPGSSGWPRPMPATPGAMPGSKRSAGPDAVELAAADHGQQRFAAGRATPLNMVSPTPSRTARRRHAVAGVRGRTVHQQRRQRARQLQRLPAYTASEALPPSARAFKHARERSRRKRPRANQHQRR